MPSDIKPPLEPKVVLGVAAHPDDLDFGAAGTMAHFAKQGAAVYYLILTDGSKGSADPDAIPTELSQQRHAEQQAALQAVGGKEVFFLDHTDGELVVSLELKKQIVEVIRRVKPDVVITMDPSVLYSAERGFINHPDHRAAGQACLDAVFPLARDHLAFPELAEQGLAPHKTPTVLLSNFNEQNYAVDISDTFEQKAAALRAHASQIADVESVIGFIRQGAEKAGTTYGMRLAEAFIRIDLNR